MPTVSICISDVTHPLTLLPCEIFENPPERPDLVRITITKQEFFEWIGELLKLNTNRGKEKAP